MRRASSPAAAREALTASSAPPSAASARERKPLRGRGRIKDGKDKGAGSGSGVRRRGRGGEGRVGVQEPAGEGVVVPAANSGGPASRQQRRGRRDGEARRGPSPHRRCVAILAPKVLSHSTAMLSSMGAAAGMGRWGKRGADGAKGGSGRREGGRERGGMSGARERGERGTARSAGREGWREWAQRACTGGAGCWGSPSLSCHRRASPQRAPPAHPGRR